MDPLSAHGRLLRVHRQYPWLSPPLCLQLMRNYHVRISLSGPSTPPAASTSYTPPSPISSFKFVPSSLFQSLPCQNPQSTTRRYTVTEKIVAAEAAPRSSQDYRLGPIRIDWVDCAPEVMSGGSMKKKERVTDGRSKEPVVATFTSSLSTSGSTNLPEGIVHIYRETSAGLESVEVSPSTQGSSAPVVNNMDMTSAPDGEGLILGVLAVPAWMTSSDFLAFVSPAADGISLLRMIRDSAPNRSLVLLKFRDSTDAAQFAEVYNGKPFNSMEPEICHVVRVRSVIIDSDESISGNVTRDIMQHNNDPTYELPTCPVCLERMDSAVTGLVTVPCSHTFHCSCLSKWGDSRCPVCRYSQTLLSSHPPSSHGMRSIRPFSHTSPAPRCFECESTANLWICLICGHVGCGRYGRAHAHGHYTRTTHLYALELETQRVWDYAGDGYVHRLIQNKADGKLVELPSASSTIGARGDAGDRTGPSREDALSAEKIEAIGIEYSYLLTSQLDSQRAFYEEQITDLRSNLDQIRDTVQKMSTEHDEDKKRLQASMAAQRDEEKARYAAQEASVAMAQKRAEKSAELVARLTQELKGERAVSKGLLENLQKAKAEVQLAHQEKQSHVEQVRELEEQLRDVMFSLEARNTIENGQGLVAEAMGGSVELASNGTQKEGKKRRNKVK